MSARRQDLYGRRDPRELPVYTVAEAAQHIRMPATTLGTWVSGYRPSGASRRAPALFKPASPKPRLLSFSNLIEAFVLAAIRRRYGVAMQRVRAALRYVRTELEVDRPLINAKFETDGVDLFIDRFGKLVNASRAGQIEMREAIEAHLARIDWDAAGVAERLFPFVRTGSLDQPKHVVIDPRRGYGRPVLAGTGVRTSVIVERYRAGDSVVALADDYGIGPLLIEDAVRCELGAAA